MVTPAQRNGRLLARRYQLQQVLGRGAMGAVWAAEDTVLGRLVAVKEVVLPPGLSPEERAVSCERTLREARAIARLGHPNVVTLFDVLDEDARPWVVMELVPSRSLADAIKQDGPIHPIRAATIGLAVLGALEAAHAAGITHRDIKPGNILLADDGRVKLTDFGIARAAGDSTITGTGLLVGSPSYIAPEIVRGLGAAPPADLWGLGATIYAAVEGRAPFSGQDTMDTLAKVVQELPAPFQRAGALAPALLRMLEKDPTRRATAVEARRLLLDVLRGGQDAGYPQSGPLQPAAVSESVRSGTLAGPVAAGGGAVSGLAALLTAAGPSAYGASTTAPAGLARPPRPAGPGRPAVPAGSGVAGARARPVSPAPPAATAGLPGYADAQRASAGAGAGPEWANAVPGSPTAAEPVAIGAGPAAAVAASAAAAPDPEAESGAPAEPPAGGWAASAEVGAEFVAAEPGDADGGSATAGAPGPAPTAHRPASSALAARDADGSEPAAPGSEPAAADPVSTAALPAAAGAVATGVGPADTDAPPTAPDTVRPGDPPADRAHPAAAGPRSADGTDPSDGPASDADLGREPIGRADEPIAADSAIGDRLVAAGAATALGGAENPVAAQQSSSARPLAAVSVAGGPASDVAPVAAITRLEQGPAGRPPRSVGPALGDPGDRSFPPHPRGGHKPTVVVGRAAGSEPTDGADRTVGLDPMGGADRTIGLDPIAGADRTVGLEPAAADRTVALDPAAGAPSTIDVGPPDAGRSGGSASPGRPAAGPPAGPLFNRRQPGQSEYPPPGYPQSGYLQSGHPRPGDEQPGHPRAPYGQSGYDQSRYGQSGYGRSGPGQSGHRWPGYGQPEYGQPEYGQPEYGQPEYGQPGYGQPEYRQPEYRQPEYRQPGYGQPEYGQPEYEQSEYGQSGYGQALYGQMASGRGPAGGPAAGGSPAGNRTPGPDDGLGFGGSGSDRARLGLDDVLSQDPRRAAAKRQSRERTTLVVVAVLVVAALVGGYLAVRVLFGGSKSTPARSSSSSSPAGPSGPAAVPVGFTQYTGPGGFTAEVPQGWRPKRKQPDVMDVIDPVDTDPSTGRFLRFIFGDRPGNGPQALLASAEPKFVRGNQGYQRLRLAPVDYRGYPAADWEFTYDNEGTVRHVLFREFVVSGKLYGVYLSAPEQAWAASRHYFSTAASTFRLSS